MANGLTKSNFYFKPDGFGAYLVTYETNFGRGWMNRITDMPLIDAVRNEEKPLRYKLRQLAQAVRLGGRRIY